MVADHLSRPPPACQPAAALAAAVVPAHGTPPPAPIDYTAMAAAQLSCPEVAALRTSSSLTIVTRDMEGQQLWGDTSTGTFRPLVPQAFKNIVFNFFHSISHQGTRASKRLILGRFVWRRAAADITAMARACLTCQRGPLPGSGQRGS